MPVRFRNYDPVHGLADGFYAMLNRFNGRFNAINDVCEEMDGEVNRRHEMSCSIEKLKKKVDITLAKLLKDSASKGVDGSCSFQRGLFGAASCY